MCIGGAAPPPKLQDRTSPDKGSRPSDEAVRTAENPYATESQKRLENETDQKMLYRWDEHNEQWYHERGSVLADSSRDLWVDPGGMDLPEYKPDSGGGQVQL